MLFNSLEFAVFFPIVVLLYFSLPQGQRAPMLLVASCVFYMAFIPVYILVLFVTIAIDYWAGICIESSQGRRRNAYLIISIVSTCAVLFVFKYFNFFTDNFVWLFGKIGWHYPLRAMNIILPIGLSFHTFQSLSYVVEVFRGHQKAERNFGIYALYVMFFPQLVAGPIERPQNLLHQFHEVHPFDYDGVCSGLKRMAWGFFKKVVVADRLALYVNDVYGAPQNFNGLQLTLATVFFAYQIYCDFSGYSDIAIGSARILGFKLMENFDTPYYSASVSEFWRRWHISLSTWFRDYVYFPLGGSRVGKWRWCINLVITFAISGLWHGANWTYVLWGLLNGLFVIVDTMTQEMRNRLYGFVGISGPNPFRRALGITVTLGVTLAAWVFFRAKNLQDAGYILSHFTMNWDFHQIATEQFLLRQLPAAVVGIIIVEVVQLTRLKSPVTELISRLPLVPRWAGYLGITFAILLFGVFRKGQFIYFQF